MILQIMAENDAGTIAIEDCEAISHAVRACWMWKTRFRPLHGKYLHPAWAARHGRLILSVGPGLKPPVELHNSVDGRRRFRGLVDGFEDGEARLKVALDAIMKTPQVLGHALADIAEARLVPDDAAFAPIVKGGKSPRNNCRACPSAVRRRRKWRQVLVPTNWNWFKLRMRLPEKRASILRLCWQPRRCHSGRRQGALRRGKRYSRGN